jgi:hypothetical protein
MRRTRLRGARSLRTWQPAVGVMIVPRHVLGGPGYQARSDRVNVAAVGYSIRSLESNDINAILKGTNNGVIALCDVDKSDRVSARFETMASRAG